MILDRSTLLKYLPDQPATNLAIYLRPGADADGGAPRSLKRRLADYRVVVAPNQDAAPRMPSTIFDRTFAITYALEARGHCRGHAGRGEFAAGHGARPPPRIRPAALPGRAPAQIRRMILLEAGFLGLLADLLGLALGFVLSLVLIYVINKQSFGWTIQFHPPCRLAGGALLLVWCATVLAGLYPARVGGAAQPDRSDS